MKKQPFFDNKYLKRVALWAAVSILSLGFAFYVGYHLAAGFQGDIKTMFARRTTLVSTVTCDGYVFRKEIPIPSVSSGSLCSALENGEKVRSGMTVAEIYSSPSPETEKKLSLIDRQISLIENCKTMALSIGDTGSVDDGIFTTLVDMRRASENGNLAKETSFRSDLFLKMKKRDVLTGEITDFDARIAELEAEKERLRGSLGSLVASVTSPASGYYYSECDGYEELFSSDKIDSLSSATLSSLLATDPASVEGTAGKVVTTHKWYLVCPMSRSDASKISAGAGKTEVTLQNNSECPLVMTVYDVRISGDDAIVIFRCEDVREGFDFTRSQTVTIVTGETTGFKVPVSAVRIVDGVEGVYIIDEIKVEFRRIDVIDESGGYYLCREVSEDNTVSDETEEEEPSPEEAGPEEEPKGTVPWLKQNDLMITGGSGLSEGMTHLPPRK